MRTWAGVAAVGVLLSGCAGAGTTAQQASAEITGEPVRVLDKQQVLAVLPDAAALKGWKDSDEPLAEDEALCQLLSPELCEGVEVYGYSGLSRAPKTSDGVILQFVLYSCRDERAAHELFEGMGTEGTELRILGSLGDERIALKNTSVRPAYLETRVRAGTTVMVATAAGSPKSASSARAEKAMKLLYERVRQAKRGAEPEARSAID